MQFLLISSDEHKAKLAVEAGVDKIFIDMETLGKEERQKGRGAVFNNHTVVDLERVSRHIPSSNLLVRINPINPESELEIEQVIEYKPGYIMLPYFKEIEQVRTFSRLVASRTKKYLLFETFSSLELIPDILNERLYDEIHLGLNDLSIELGTKCIFKVLFDKRFLKAVKLLKDKGIKFGIGGVGKIGQHEIPAEMLLKQYISLGAQVVILSRSFNSDEVWENNADILKSELAKIQDVVVLAKNMNQQEREENSQDLLKILDKF